MKLQEIMISYSLIMMLNSYLVRIYSSVDRFLRDRKLSACNARRLIAGRVQGENNRGDRRTNYFRFFHAQRGCIKETNFSVARLATS